MKGNIGQLMKQAQMMQENMRIMRNSAVVQRWLQEPRASWREPPVT